MNKNEKRIKIKMTKSVIKEDMTSLSPPQGIFICSLLPHRRLIAWKVVFLEAKKKKKKEKKEKKKKRKVKEKRKKRKKSKRNKERN